MDIKIGEYAKVANSSRVFKVHSFTKGQFAVSDGWYVDKYGSAINPKYCEKYNGAISAVIKHA